MHVINLLGGLLLPTGQQRILFHQVKIPDTNTITRSSSLTPVSYGEALKTTVVLVADVSCV